MDNLQPYKISLDFYIRKIITVNAKQLDSGSRIINITCTENCKKFFVDSSTLSAFVRYKKSDGHAVLNQVDILEDGTVNLELSQQMLAVEGRHLVDIMLINKSELTLFTDNISVADDGEGNVTVLDYEKKDVVNMNVEEILTAISENEIKVLSTMSFYINTEGVTIDGAKIESSYEYDALIEGLGKMVAVDNRMSTLEQTINDNETQRKENERTRQEAEIIREQILEETKSTLNEAKTATENAKQATSNAQTATNNANTATESANTATENANNATANANHAAQETRNVLYNGGMVLKTDIIHDLETEDENKVPDATQVKMLKAMVDDLQAQLDATHKVYFGIKEPTSDIGKDGDIYMMLIVEDDEIVASEVGE